MWYWPTNSTAPTWVSSPTTAWVPTPTTSSATTNTIWYQQQMAQIATTSICATVSQADWQAAAVLATWTDSQMHAHLYPAQTAMAQQNAYERYQFQLYNPQAGFQLHTPAAPALITHQEEVRRDEALYRRALAEHNEQEAARVLRLIETRAQSEAQRQQLIAAQAQQRHEDQQQRTAASERARELLLEHLTPAQRDTVTRHGWFVIEGGRTKTKYRIRTGGGVAGNIDVLDARDRITYRLCCHAQSHIPAADQWLAQKIMLELAEDDFLRTANRHAA